MSPLQMHGWRVRVGPLVAAAVLLVAAGLKAHGLLVRPLSSGSPLLPRAAEFLAVYLEILLALWLLSGWQRPVAWLVALATFTCFAGVSAWLGWLGHSSCGCFGEVQASPWFALGLDLVVIALLVASYPARSAWQGVRWAFWGRSVMLFTLAALLGGASWWGLAAAGRDPADWIADWRGERLVLQPAFIEVGAGPPGRAEPFTITLFNRSGSTVRVVGGTADCGCLATSDLPLELPPGGRQTIRIEFKRSGQPGLFKRGFWLYTDDARQRFVVAWFTGRTLAPPPALEP